MITFVIRRLMISVVSMVAIAIVSWILIQLPPGDYVTRYVEQMIQRGEQLITPEEEENLPAYFGVDKPQYIQFMKWVVRMFEGDFGMSFEWGLPIRQLIW